MSEHIAGILTIGDELLIGQIMDTNGPWLSRKMAEGGWKVRHHVTVGDREKDIVEALRGLAEECEVVLVTGGLGPTEDDVTLQAVASFSNRELVFFPEVEQKILAYFKARNRKVTPFHQKQFYLPEGIEILKNEAGTAPGLYLPLNGVHFFFMPGVPSELKYIFKHSLRPRLSEIVSPLFSQVRIFTAGIGETAIAEMIQDDLSGWPDWVDIAYLPYAGGVRLRITADGSDPDQNKSVLEDITRQIRQYLGPSFISTEQDGWNKVMKDYCIRREITVGVAESCTGGFIASQLTLIPDAGQYFQGGIVSYANSVKEKVLGVRTETLETHGAVSAQCAEEMLRGVLEVTGADAGVAVTGIAGPAGGSPDKPVGTVFICAGDRDKRKVKKVFYKSVRAGIIEYTYNQAMYELYKFLSER